MITARKQLFLEDFLYLLGTLFLCCLISLCMVVNRTLLWLVPTLHTVLLALLDMEQQHLLVMEQQDLLQGMVQQCLPLGMVQHHALHQLVLILQLFKEQHHVRFYYSNINLVEVERLRFESLKGQYVV